MNDAPETEQPVRLHHWLVAGKVIFAVSPGEGQDPRVSEFEHNATITNTEFCVTANMIGKAQFAMQVELHKQSDNDPTLQVITVVIGSVNYLGEMTKEQFYTPPPVGDTAAGADGAPAAIDLNDPYLTKTTH